MVCPGRINTNISYNALEVDGTKHAKMDSGQQGGMSLRKQQLKLLEPSITASRSIGRWQRANHGIYKTILP